MTFHRLCLPLLSLAMLPACASTTAGMTSASDFELPRCAAAGTSDPGQDSTPLQAMDRPGDVVLFHESLMEKPKLLSGPIPRYTQEALQQGVEGRFISRCIITHGGETEGCCVVKTLAEEEPAAARAQAGRRYEPAIWNHMDAVILSAIHEQRYTPITWKGQPLDVDYTFTVNLKRSRPSN